MAFENGYSYATDSVFGLLTAAQQGHVKRLACPKCSNFMVASEGPAPTDEPHMNRDDYNFFTVLREPAARYESHFAHHFRTRCNKKALGMAFAAHLEHGTRDFGSWLRTVPDNWMARQFCGALCEGVPFGHLNATHIARATQALQRFDAVLVLEEMNQLLPLLRFVTGWKQGDPTSHRAQTRAAAETKVTMKNSSTVQANTTFSISTRKLLVGMTRWDAELYAYAQFLGLAQLRMLPAGAELPLPAESATPRRNEFAGCTNPCCTATLAECGTMQWLWKTLQDWHGGQQHASDKNSKAVLFDSYHKSTMKGVSGEKRHARPLTAQRKYKTFKA